MMNVYTRDIKIYLEDEVIGSCYDYILEDESEIMNNEIRYMTYLLALRKLKFI